MKRREVKCDNCGEPTDKHVKAVYTVPGYVMEWFYCCEDCKQEHKLKLIRESGL